MNAPHPLPRLEVSYRLAPIRITTPLSPTIIPVPPAKPPHPFDAACDRAARERAFFRKAGVL